jgi:hypothetical protein
MNDIRDTVDAVEVEGPSKAVGQAIQDAILADLEPVPARSLGARVGAVVGVVALGALLAVASFGATGFERAPTHLAQLGVLGAVTLVGVLALGASFAPFAQSRFGSREKGVLVALWVLGWALYLSSQSSGGSLSLAEGGWGCAVRGLAAGALAAVGMMWVWRRADPWSPRMTGAFIGAAAGCIASAAVGVVCTMPHAGHLMIGHWLAVPLLALGGALVSRRALAP